MKKETIIFIILGIIISIFIGFATAGLVEQHRIEKKLDELNRKIHELENEGYSTEASKKISLTEMGFIPADAEYNALKED